MFIYSFYDTVAESVRGITISENDGMVIRENARGLAQIYPLADILIRKIGEIDKKSGAIEKMYTDTEIKTVPWDAYKFPESPLKKLDKDEIREKN